MNTSDVVALYVLFTRSEKFLSNIICHIDGGPYSHMGIGYKLRTGEEIYFEALAGRGFEGPRPLSDLIGWQTENPMSRRVIILEIHPLAPLAEGKLIDTESFAGRVTYSEWQLALLFFVIKFGWNISETRTRVICSEIVARILAPDIDLRDEERRIFDVVTPGSAWRRLQALDAESQQLFGKLLYSIRYVAGPLPENTLGGPITGDLRFRASIHPTAGDRQSASLYRQSALWSGAISSPKNPGRSK